MNHLSHEELLDLAGGQLGADRAAIAGVHLAGCAECARQLDQARAFDSALRAMPLERAPAELSRSVLKRLGIREAQSWLYTLLMNFAPLAALLSVLTIVYLVLGRQPSEAGAQSSGESARALLQMADAYGVAGVQSVNAWVGTYLSFMKTSAGVTGFLVLFLGAIALLDKYVFMPLLRRRIQ